MYRLDAQVMPYAWGSRTAISDLTGRAPTSHPEAEMWMGAHPVAPSKTRSRDSGDAQGLDELIARDPEHALGAQTVKQLGTHLPFLLKVLAASEPLSLQAHPTAKQAAAGFDREEAVGISRTAANRNYKDRHHKPELLCALGTFDALSGFRAIPDTIRLFEQLNVAALDPVLAPLRATRDADGLRATFEALMTMKEPAALVRHVVAACSLASPHFARERALAEWLQQLYPDDVGIISALFLHYVRLEAGDAIYLGAGNLHAYLEGTGVEIMAASDNVLRGGLTKKHVDVPELLACLDFAGGPARVLKPRELDACESAYDTPAAEFRLSRIRVSTGISREPFGPEILLTTEGSVHVASNHQGAIEAPRGASVFVPAATGRYTLNGDGVVYRATINCA